MKLWEILLLTVFGLFMLWIVYVSIQIGMVR